MRTGTLRSPSMLTVPRSPTSRGSGSIHAEISKTKTEDTLTVVDAVKGFLEEQRAIAPPKVVFEITRDVSSIVRDRLSLLIKNGVQGLILVALTLWLFFSWRFSFWVAAAFQNLLC